MSRRAARVTVTRVTDPGTGRADRAVRAPGAAPVLVTGPLAGLRAAALDRSLARRPGCGGGAR